MKIGKVWLTVLMVSVVVVCFGLSTGHAQNLNRWENTWFSITASASGWEIEGSPETILTSKGSAKGFLNFVELEDKSLAAHLYTQNLSGAWAPFAEGACSYEAGSDLDVICVLAGELQAPLSGGFDTFIRITGKLDTKTQLLKSATLKSSGGIVKGNLDEEYPTLTIGGVTLTGSLLNPSTYCKGSKLTTSPCLK